MSKAKWFVVGKPSTGVIITTSANQILPPKFLRGTNYIQQTPLSSWSVEGGNSDIYHLVMYLIESQTGYSPTAHEKI